MYETNYTLQNLTNGIMNQGQLQINSPDQFTQPIVNVVVDNSHQFHQWAIYCILFYFTIILFHEIGHLLALHHYLKKNNVALINPHIYIGIKQSGYPRIYTGPEVAYQYLEASEKAKVYLAGIVAGYAVILVLMFAHPLYALLAIPYTMGLKSDINLIIYNFKKKKEENVVKTEDKMEKV